MASIHLMTDLLDRHIADKEGEPVGKVDDVEFSAAVGSPPSIVALLVGPQAYGRRIGGRVGSWITRAARRAAQADDRLRLEVDLVEDLSSKVTLKVDLDDLDEGGALERWLRKNFIRRIPGGRDESE